MPEPDALNRPEGALTRPSVLLMGVSGVEIASFEKALCAFGVSVVTSSARPDGLVGEPAATVFLTSDPLEAARDLTAGQSYELTTALAIWERQSREAPPWVGKPKRTKPCKGETTLDQSHTERSCFALSGLDRCSGLIIPGRCYALPWADMLLPRRGEAAGAIRSGRQLRLGFSMS